MRRILIIMLFACTAMADLPSVYNPEPVTLPAQSIPEITYDASYIVSMVISNPDKDGEQNVQIWFRPYSSVAKKMYPDRSKDFPLSFKLFAESARLPLLAQTMASVLSTSSLVLQEKTIKDKISALPAEDPGLAALRAQLATIQTQLGISNVSLKP